MSRGEPIASPVDPTLDGYKGSLTLVPAKEKGAPSKVDGGSCVRCGGHFEPECADETLCPRCRQADLGVSPSPREDAEARREAAITKAEKRWERLQKRWRKR